MADNDAVAARGQDGFGLPHKAGLGRGSGEDAADRFNRPARPGPPFQGKHIRNQTSRMLFNESRVSRGQQARIQGVTNGNRPALVEMVKYICVNSAPIVNWHGLSLPAELASDSYFILSGQGQGQATFRSYKAYKGI